MSLSSAIFEDTWFIVKDENNNIISVEKAILNEEQNKNLEKDILVLESGKRFNINTLKSEDLIGVYLDDFKYTQAQKSIKKWLEKYPRSKFSHQILVQIYRLTMPILTLQEIVKITKRKEYESIQYSHLEPNTNALSYLKNTRKEDSKNG